jgi:hypothetical protein
MKTFKIVVFLLILSSVSVSAQYRDRNGMPNNPSDSKPSPEKIEKERAERIEKLMEKLKTDLNLDELQAIAIRNEITANGKNMDIIIKSQMTDEDKAKEIKALQEKLDKSINSYLNSTQKEKYLAMKEDRNNKKEDKKKKKSEN